MTFSVMELVIGVVISTALITFCLISVYSKGYKAGARRVLEEWKQELYMTGDK